MPLLLDEPQTLSRYWQGFDRPIYLSKIEYDFFAYDSHQPHIVEAKE